MCFVSVLFYLLMGHQDVLTLNAYTVCFSCSTATYLSAHDDSESSKTLSLYYIDSISR